MGIKRFGSRMMMCGSDMPEPNMDYWLYTQRTNESGYTVNTLYFYNNSKEPKNVVVPSEMTELQDWQQSGNNAYANLPFFNHQTIENIDLQNVPFRNGSMLRAFASCLNLISVTNINDNVTDMSYAFASCNKFNQSVTIPNSVTNMACTFYMCNSFNSPVTIPDSVTTVGMTFSRSPNFNAPVTIGNSVTNMNQTFYYCPNFNSPVTIGNSVTDMANTFSSCNKFNQAVTIPNSVTNMECTFYWCFNFNQPVTIPDSVTNMTSTFSSCNNFNQPVTIGNSVLNMRTTFLSCDKFNQPLIIPDSVSIMDKTFYRCNSFNSLVTIGKGVTNMYYAFQFCNNMSADIIIQSEVVASAYNCFYGTTLNKNVYIPMVTTASFLRFTNTISVYYPANKTIKMYYGTINNTNIFTRDTTNDRVINGIQYYAWTNSTTKVSCYTNVEVPAGDTYPYIFQTAGQETITYNSFKKTGYSTTTRKDGVLLFDINSYTG